MRGSTMTTTITPLAQLRIDLTEAKAALRDAQDDYKLTRAQSEQQAIAGGINGKNADERERNLLVALNDDLYHNRALARLRGHEHTVDRIEAQLESLLDDRRAWEWSIRSALIDALGQSGKDDTQAFDDASLSTITDRLETLANDRSEQYRDVAREMITAYNTGMADRINGAGEYEEDDCSTVNSTVDNSYDAATERWW